MVSNMLRIAPPYRFFAKPRITAGAGHRARPAAARTRSGRLATQWSLSPVKYRLPVLPESALSFLGIFALGDLLELGQERLQRGFFWADRLMRRSKCRAHAQRCPGGDLLRQLDGAVELLSGRRHLLHEAKTVGFIGSPFFACEHIAHRISPAGLAGEPDRRPAAGKDPTRDLVLSKG